MSAMDIYKTKVYGFLYTFLWFVAAAAMLMLAILLAASGVDSGRMVASALLCGAAGAGCLYAFVHFLLMDWTVADE